MNNMDDTRELFSSTTEMLGMNSVDFIMNDATFIRIEVINKSPKKVIPMDLVEAIAKLIQDYQKK